MNDTIKGQKHNISNKQQFLKIFNIFNQYVRGKNNIKTQELKEKEQSQKTI